MNSSTPARRVVDLSHRVEDGMITYPGLPAPTIRPFLTRAASRERYAPGTEFHIGRIDLVANTGTYVDTPFHRFADAPDLSTVDLCRLVDVPGVVVNASTTGSRAINREFIDAALAGVDARGLAVLVYTGWAKHWGTQRYFEGHPYLTADAAESLVARGITLLGVDSLNVDDTTGGHRPVHTTVLGAGIPVVEHLCGLEQLPPAGFRFSAVPPPIAGMGSFPVRAYAIF
jgi:arylformamidase